MMLLSTSIFSTSFASLVCAAIEGKKNASSPRDVRDTEKKIQTEKKSIKQKTWRICNDFVSNSTRFLMRTVQENDSLPVDNQKRIEERNIQIVIFLWRSLICFFSPPFHSCFFVSFFPHLLLFPLTFLFIPFLLRLCFYSCCVCFFVTKNKISIRFHPSSLFWD